MFDFVMYIVDLRFLNIVYMGYCSHYNFWWPMHTHMFGLIINLSSFKGFDIILAMVDQLTKTTHYLPCTKTILTLWHRIQKLKWCREAYTMCASLMCIPCAPSNLITNTNLTSFYLTFTFNAHTSFLTFYHFSHVDDTL